ARAPDGATDAPGPSPYRFLTKVRFSSGIDEAFAVAIGPDDKIVIAGSAGSHLALARLTPEGMLDSTFGTAGIAVSTFNAAGHGVAILSDGRIVVGGDAGGRLTLWRYLADGSPDPGFTGGTVGTSGLSAAAMAVAPDGHIVIGASSASS